MIRTGSRALSVVAVALVALVATSAVDASAQNGGAGNPISAFFNAIFGGAQQPSRAPSREYRRDVRPSEPVPNRQYRQRSRQTPQRQQRNTRPARRSAPQPATVAKNPDAMQVVVFGDQLAGGLADGLEEAFADNADVAITNAAAKDDGLIGQDGGALPQKVRAYLADPEKKLDAAVVMIGANDRKPIRQAADEVAFDTERWRDLYAQRTENVMAIFAAKGKPLYWVGLPPVADAKTGTDFAFFNEIFRARGYRTGTEFVDIWNGFVDENDAYALSGPDVKGEIRDLREEDGIGFTGAGNRKLAHFVARELRRDFVRGGEFVSELPALPEQPHPYRPSDEMLETGRGEIVTLNGSPRPGGLLAGGLDEGPTPPEDSAYYKVILKGEAPEPQPGRSDDFSWPPASAGG